MGTIAQKLQKAQESKEAIKAAIIAKGVKDVDDNLSNYAGYINSIQSGAGGGDLDFTQIGYSGTPKNIIDGFEYAKKIKAEWKVSDKMSHRFDRDLKLIFMPLIDTSQVEDFAYAFSDSSVIYIPDLDTSNAKYAQNMLHGTVLEESPHLNLANCLKIDNMFTSSRVKVIRLYNTKKVTSASGLCNYNDYIEVIPDLDLPECLALQSAFRNDKNLKKVGKLNTPKVEDFYELFWLCTKLEIVESLDFSSVKNTKDAFHAPIKSMTIRNLGKSSLTDYNFTQILNESWGDESTGIVGARQSLVDSLLTYSYDRKANGLPVATITLGKGVKARLTSQEIEQITNKGYNIA